MIRKYTGKDCRIDITGISELAILAELHNHTSADPNHTYLQDCPLTHRFAGDICTQEATRGYLIEEPYFPEYLFGRPIKAFIKRKGNKTFLVHCDQYDQNAGKGMAIIAVNSAHETYRDLLR